VGKRLGHRNEAVSGAIASAATLGANASIVSGPLFTLTVHVGKWVVSAATRCARAIDASTSLHGA